MVLPKTLILLLPLLIQKKKKKIFLLSHFFLKRYQKLAVVNTWQSKLIWGARVKVCNSNIEMLNTVESGFTFLW